MKAARHRTGKLATEPLDRAEPVPPLLVARPVGPSPDPFTLEQAEDAYGDHFSWTGATAARRMLKRVSAQKRSPTHEGRAGCPDLSGSISFPSARTARQPWTGREERYPQRRRVAPFRLLDHRRTHAEFVGQFRTRRLAGQNLQRLASLEA